MSNQHSAKPTISEAAVRSVQHDSAGFHQVNVLIAAT